jgi:hypothetical protein
MKLTTSQLFQNNPLKFGQISWGSFLGKTNSTRHFHPNIVIISNKYPLNEKLIYKKCILGKTKYEKNNKYQINKLEFRADKICLFNL